MSDEKPTKKQRARLQSAASRGVEAIRAERAARIRSGERWPASENDRLGLPFHNPTWGSGYYQPGPTEARLRSYLNDELNQWAAAGNPPHGDRTIEYQSETGQWLRVWTDPRDPETGNPMTHVQMIDGPGAAPVG